MQRRRARSTSCLLHSTARNRTVASIKNRPNDARRTQTTFWTGVEESKTDAQAGFLDLLVSLCPPMLRIVPVIRPTAKNAKYIRAAGSCTWAVNKGGRLKSTCARLCKPINTKSMKIAATNNILINNIAFISFLCGAARSLFRGHANPSKASCLPFSGYQRSERTKGGATPDAFEQKAPRSSSPPCRRRCRANRAAAQGVALEIRSAKCALRIQTVQNSISFAVAARPLLV